MSHDSDSLDRFGRPLRSLRVSVTDRCNLRCLYCMPEADYVWLPREEILSYEEISSLVGAFVSAGVRRVRITGGEPLVRRDLPDLVALLAKKSALEDLALTTNGVDLAERVAELKAAGLRRLTISLDSLRPATLARITGREAMHQVVAGIDAACAAGFESVKLNTVVLRGLNDDEIPDLVRFAAERGAEPRFVEYMDVGGATRWSSASVVRREEILTRLESAFGEVTPVPQRGSAPAERFRLPDGTIVAIVASTTAPFCGACDRSRLTADGTWYTCLYGLHGISLRDALRGGASTSELARRIEQAWSRRTDRGAEERLRAQQRGIFVPLESLRADPRLEMHTRGG